ncbi:hypothetical protein L596_014833 [Steinernema carpocapsae]|uniref:Uncharacterized protein n=1 Tax=Steinernema carpocapsae TaxID=34508 RepID=A0A4U5NDM9_STECR|nr:hypothetical protein L596_014833 [Steinernema carpocapsae]
MGPGQVSRSSGKPLGAAQDNNAPKALLFENGASLRAFSSDYSGSGLDHLPRLMAPRVHNQRIVLDLAPFLRSLEIARGCDHLRSSPDSKSSSSTLPHGPPASIDRLVFLD